MSEPGFRERAAEVIAEGRVAPRIAAAVDHRRERRTPMLGRTGNWQALRDAGRTVRSEVVSRLPDVLERLAASAEAAGTRVFFAADAAEANRYVIDVARRHGARRIVKAKSMVTEEIHLNAALGDAGLDVVETDLGEWILQLAGQTPAHIIAPAVHMDRSDIARVFAAHGRTEASDRPEDLNAYARATLREEFLRADVGISGCNFAIAETGTLCIVTNEGNGRMVTSVPPVHIVVMGMERVVETWQQYDLMMSLLPRVNGVDLTVYTSAMTGPRRPGEVDGPDEVHLVIVDNGRSGLLGTEFQSALHCIRCGACLDVCPVFRQIGGQVYGPPYSGPIGAVITPQLIGGETVDLAKASTLCGACYDVCPVMIPLQDLLLAQRRLNAVDASPFERTAWRLWSAAWRRPSVYRRSAAAGRGIARVVPRWMVPRRWSAGRTVPRPGKPPRRHGEGGR